MALTYVPVSAIEFAKKYIKNMPLEDLQLEILTNVHKQIWGSGDWTWTVGTISPITLVQATETFSITPPADFERIYRAAMVWSNKMRYLKIVSSLPNLSAALTGLPRLLTYEATGPNVRIFPCLGTGGVPSGTIVPIWYKKVPAVLTATNVTQEGSLQMDDVWSWVYEAGVLWYAFVYAFDQRAGQVTTSTGGQSQYTGQLAVFMDGIRQMKERAVLPEIVPDVEDEPTEGIR